MKSVGALGLAGMESISLRAAAWCCVLDMWLKPCWQQGQCVGCCWAVLSHFATLPPTVSRLRMGMKLGRDTTWTVNPEWPRVYSMPRNALENLRKGILGEVVIAIGQRLAVHQSPCGRWWLIAFTSPWSFFPFSLCCLFKCLYLKPGVFLVLLFLFSSLCHWQGQWARSCGA